MRPEKKGKRPAPPTTPMSCAAESPLRMWTPQGEISPMCMEMGLRSIESVRSETSCVSRARYQETPAQAQASKAAEEALKGELEYYKGLCGFFTSVIDTQLAKYFSGLSTIVQSHLWLSQEGFLPHAQHQLVADAETAALTLRNKFLTLEATSLTQHEQDLAATTELKLKVSERASTIANLEKQLSAKQQLLKKQGHEIESQKCTIETLQAAIKVKDDRLKKQFENHHARLVELKEERDHESAQTKHKQAESSATIKRLKAEVSSLKEELETAMTDAKELRLQAARAERRADTNTEKLKKYDATQARAKALAQKCQDMHYTCSEYLISFEASDRSLVMLDESTSFAQLANSHYHRQIQRREKELLDKEARLQQSVSIYTTNANALRERQQSATQRTKESEALMATLQEELHLKTKSLNSALQTLGEKEQQHNELLAKLAALEHRLQDTDSQFTEAADQNAATLSELAAAKADKGTLSRRLLELEQDIAAKTHACEELKAVNKTLSEQLKQAKEASANLVTKVEDTTDELVDATHELDCLKAKHQSLAKAAAETQGEMQEEINHLRRVLNDYNTRLQGVSDYDAVAERLRRAEMELCESHKMSTMLDALNDDLDKYHADNVFLKDELQKKELGLAEAGLYRQRYLDAERARKATAAQLKVIKDTYESTVGTVTSTTPTHVRTDTTNRFMVKVRAWYREVRASQQPAASPPAPSPSPPPVPTRRTAPKAPHSPSPSLDRWAASRSRSVSPALSL